MDHEQIMLAGDWHGFASHANWVLERAQRRGIDVVFQLGDFGLWEHEPSGIEYLDDVQRAAERCETTVYFLDGNHDNLKLALDNHREVDDEGFVVIRDRVRYSPRGHHWHWNGVHFLALGGAYSVDARWRRDQEAWKTANSKIAHDRYGKTFRDYTETLWFPDEEITDEDVTRAIGDGEPVDVLLTHDKPIRSVPGWNRKDLPECHPNQERIQRVVDELSPQLLVHGHLHFPYDHALRDPRGSDLDTYVVGLDADAEAMAGERGYRRENSVAVLHLEYSGVKVSIELGDGRTILV